MERILSRRGVLAAFAAMFALAFSLCFGAMPAQASDDLAAGDADLTAQESKPGDPDYIEVEGVSYADATSDSDVVLSLYIQPGDDGEKMLIKQYTKAEIDKLAEAQTDGPLAVIYQGKGSYSVGVTTKYVLLDGLLSDAGVSKFWREGSSIDVENAKYGTYAYEDYSDAKFFPKTTVSDADADGAVSVPAMIFAISEATGAIEEDKTAQDMIDVLKDDKKQSEAAALRVYVGASEDNYKAGNKIAGNRLWSNIVNVTIIYDPAATDSMYRLYNPNSGEHFYTASTKEHDGLVELGWQDEGEGWVAPIMSTAPVYRLYNPNAGEHHYTTSEKERDGLVEKGWNDEGIGWYSDTNQGTVLYREYNPNAYACNHNYTTSKKEHDWLIEQGWQDEGTAWYGVAKDEGEAK